MLKVPLLICVWLIFFERTPRGGVPYVAEKKSEEGDGHSNNARAIYRGLSSASLTGIWPG